MPFRCVQKCRRFGAIGRFSPLRKHVSIVASRVLARQDGADPIVHRKGFLEMPLGVGPSFIDRGEDPEKPVTRSKTLYPDADIPAGPWQQELVEMGCARAIIQCEA